MTIMLKLIKGLSYRGGANRALKASKGQPFVSVETMEEAEAAMATGHFEIVRVPQAPPPAEPPAGTQEDKKQAQTPRTSAALTTADLSKPLNKMTTAELVARAAEIGVDISDCKNNDERREAIQAALDAAPEAPEPPAGTQEDPANQPVGGEPPHIPFTEEKEG